MPSRRQLFEEARTMRKNPTRPEALLWSALRRKQVDGKKFRRQHILPPYIVDFCCTSERIAVEVDGPHHDSVEAQLRNRERDEFLREHHGVRHVLRFGMQRVVVDLNGVVGEIRVVAAGERNGPR